MKNERRSIAVWYTFGEDRSKDGASGPRLEMHFNLWQCQGVNSGDDGSFLDMGLMISADQRMKEICVYLPAPSDQITITDIGEKLTDHKTAIAVFNEPLTMETSANSHELYWENGDHFSRLFQCSSDDFEVSDCLGTTPLNNGAVLKIRESALVQARHNLKSEQNIYMRFRVVLPVGNSNPFIGVLRPWDGKILTGFDRIQYVDFRLNEIRNLPDALSREIENGRLGKFQITQVHFLLVTDVAADFISGHTSFYKCRMLENLLWESYAQPTLNDQNLKFPDDMVIYHWRANTPSSQSNDGEYLPVHDFVAFLKFRIRESNLLTVSRYFILAIFVGGFGSYISSFFE